MLIVFEALVLKTTLVSDVAVSVVKATPAPTKITLLPLLAAMDTAGEAATPLNRVDKSAAPICNAPLAPAVVKVSASPVALIEIVGCADATFTNRAVALVERVVETAALCATMRKTPADELSEMVVAADVLFTRPAKAFDVIDVVALALPANTELQADVTVISIVAERSTDRTRTAKFEAEIVSAADPVVVICVDAIADVVSEIADDAVASKTLLLPLDAVIVIVAAPSTPRTRAG